MHVWMTGRNKLFMLSWKPANIMVADAVTDKRSI